MNKIVYLSELYKKSVNDLTKSREDWMGLLTGMARYYKYSFDNNVLIYTQRPDASLLATIDIWNKKIGRRINSGAKGISVIDMSNPRASLKHLFDLMDTNGSHESFRRVMGFMWELAEQYQPGIMAKFHELYGTDTASIESCIYELSEKRINEMLPGYLQDFSVADPDSIQYDLPIGAVKEQFAELTRDSVCYMVFKKCGLSTDLFEESGFENISHFNSIGLFMRLGSITMSIARPVLREINQEIENLKYERGRINEDKAIDRVDLSRGRGRVTVSRPSDIGERELRSGGSGQVWQTVEGIHDGDASPQGVGIDSRGQIQPDDNRSGRGGREPEGSPDTGAFKGPAHARNRGHSGTGGPHGNDIPYSGGNHTERSGVESEISHAAPQKNSPEGSEVLSGEFLHPENNTMSFKIGEFFEISGELHVITRYDGNRYEMHSLDKKHSDISMVASSIDSGIERGVINPVVPEKLNKLFGFIRSEIVRIDNGEYAIESFDVKNALLSKLSDSTEKLHVSHPDFPNTIDKYQYRFARFQTGGYFTISDDLYMLTHFDNDDEKYVLRKLDEKSAHISGSAEELRENIERNFFISTKPETLDRLFGFKTAEIVSIDGKLYSIDSINPRNVTLTSVHDSNEKKNLSVLEISEFLWKENIPHQDNSPLPIDSVTDYDDEDLSDAIDMFLIAKDTSPFAEDWQSEIHDFFTEPGHKQSSKADVVRAYYGTYDSQYRTDTGMDMHIKASSDGLTFHMGMHQISLTYAQLAEVIDYLIINGVYPFSNGETIDDFAIPDEIHDMHGMSDESHHLPSVTSPEELPPVTREQVLERILLQGNITHGGKESIQNAILSMQAKKDRVDFIRLAYGYTGVGMGLDGGGHFRWSADGKGIAIDYLDNTLEIKETLSWNRVEPLISDLVKRGIYLLPEDRRDDSSHELETMQDDSNLQLEPYSATIPGEESVIESQPTIEQLNLFNGFNTMPDVYEETGSEDNDNIISEDTLKENAPPSEIGTTTVNTGEYDRLTPKEAIQSKTADLQDLLNHDDAFRYQLLDRLRLDCKYYLGYRNRNAKSLWAGSVERQIEAMKTLWNSFSEENKPEWISLEEIEQYEKEMNKDDSLASKDLASKDASDTHTWDERSNYRYSPDHNLYEGGAKTKCRNNIEAIRLLKRLENEGRLATADEQAVLARFVGWGGLANALTPGKSGWEKEYAEITELLTAEEFKSAQESTTTAFYTGQNLIQHIYTALHRFGFREGNILDPAMGTGNFYSVLPESMADSKLFGVELDTITGGIARQLYPEADIVVKGFEEVNHPDHFFDVAVGNIPFNSIKVRDSRYDRHNFRIHDYFIAKTLDKVRSGGIIAFITSKYTLDKANPTVRKYIAQRAELIGAIRLPNNAFKFVSRTEATTDIIFLQKRDNEIVPDEKDSPWITVEENEDGIPINSYFIDHPEMVLGKMVFDESMYGNEKTTACHPRKGDDLDKLLENAVYYLDGQYREPSTSFTDDKETVTRESIPADPSLKNYCYAMVDGELYYRENSRMYRQNVTGRKRERIEGMIEVRSSLRSLIAFQTDPYYDEGGDLPTMEYEKRIQGFLDNLNEKYDSFVKQHGYVNSLANITAFSKDSDAPLLRSIEKENENKKGQFEKTATFFKATIKPKVMPKSADSAEEALKISLNIKGRVDLDYMHWLYQRPDFTKPEIDEIIAELGIRIYQEPMHFTGDPHTGWVTAEEYLSGNVRAKLSEGLLKAEQYPERFTRNVEALREVQPEPLTPQDISFTLGSTWIPVEFYQQYMYEKFQTYRYHEFGSGAIEIEHSTYSGAYHITGKSSEKDSVAVNKTYGTERKNAYEILEDTLNLKSVTVKDRVDYVDPATGEDKVKYVLNKVETVLAREKQAQIKMEFESWLFADPQRGASLTQLYNDRFNNTRPRQYDGSDLMLPDISSGIKLRGHQLDVIAHGIYGDGNLLMAHEVGAGKTMSSIVIAHELKRLGVFQKPLITVPNHLVGQWAAEYLRLYPSDNILVAEKKDLQRSNRRRFVSRIATGDFDTIIMAHSSFELINLSREKQLSVLEKDISEITKAIEMEKFRQGKSWSLKQMQIFQKNLQYRYDRLFKAEKKDDTINFEELGVDMLIVDEAHTYKNNFSYTKLRNVAGISSKSSQRAMDMHMKCQHINDMNDGKGVVYLTGTPVSNSMSELFVMQKTLQPKELLDRGLMMFDSWASTFGKIEASLEIRPEGNGYQMKNRFSQFHNLPELMSIFSLVADIKTSDMLPDLPVPELVTGGVQVIKTPITPGQKNIVDELVMRAEDIREKRVSSDEDNFLKLTNEARLLAVDPRILAPLLPDYPETKLNVCACKTADIYHETGDMRLTQCQRR